MNKLTFYEQVGIVIPGSVLLFGLMFFVPGLRELLGKDGVSVGQLGMFVLISYAAGHLIAAVANLGETFLWWLTGGMPSEWVVKPTTDLLAAQQLQLLPRKLGARLGVTIKAVTGMDRAAWASIVRQIYADVAAHAKSGRVDTFNANYGLNRGLAAACLALAIVAAAQQQWAVAGAMLVISIGYIYRAYRFGVHYARELFVQFLALSDTPKEKERSLWHGT